MTAVNLDLQTVYFATRRVLLAQLIEADPALGAADVCVDSQPLSIDARLSTRLAQWVADWQGRA